MTRLWIQFIRTVSCACFFLLWNCSLLAAEIQSSTVSPSARFRHGISCRLDIAPQIHSEVSFSFLNINTYPKYRKTKEIVKIFSPFLCERFQYSIVQSYYVGAARVQTPKVGCAISGGGMGVYVVISLFSFSSYLLSISTETHCFIFSSNNGDQGSRGTSISPFPYASNLRVLVYNSSNTSQFAYFQSHLEIRLLDDISFGRRVREEFFLLILFNLFRDSKPLPASSSSKNIEKCNSRAALCVFLFYEHYFDFLQNVIRYLDFKSNRRAEEGVKKKHCGVVPSPRFTHHFRDQNIEATGAPSSTNLLIF